MFVKILHALTPVGWRIYGSNSTRPEPPVGRWILKVPVAISAQGVLLFASVGRRSSSMQAAALRSPYHMSIRLVSFSFFSPHRTSTTFIFTPPHNVVGITCLHNFVWSGINWQIRLKQSCLPPGRLWGLQEVKRWQFLGRVPGLIRRRSAALWSFGGSKDPFGMV